MIRKNLLGSFIFTIILFSFALFHSGVSAEGCSQSSVLKEIQTNNQTGQQGIKLTYIGNSENCLYAVQVKNEQGTVIESISLDSNNTSSFIDTGTGNFETNIKTMEWVGVGTSRTTRQVEDITTPIQVTPPQTGNAQNPENNNYTPEQLTPTLQDTGGRPAVQAITETWSGGESGLSYLISNLDPRFEYQIQVFDSQNQPTGYTVTYNQAQLANMERDLAGNIIIRDKIALPDGVYKLQVIKTANGNFEFPNATFVTQASDSPTYRVNKSSAQSVALNETPPTANNFTNTPPIGNNPPANADVSVVKIVGELYKFLLPIAVVIAIIKLLISIIGLTTSSGDPQRLQQAKEDITATLLGLLVVIGAVTLINIIGSAIGL